MTSSPFLLGAREISSKRDRESDSFDEDEAPIKQYQLAAAKQIVILDDYISYRLFKDSLICAPEEEVLEAFYMALGSQTLGSLVQEDIRIGPHTEKKEDAVWLRKHVLERSKIFLYEYSKYKRDSIKHDAKWLEKNLIVQVVRSLALRRSLSGQGKSHTEKRSAASARTSGGFTLYIAAEGRPDMYQVGQAVCQLLLTRPSQQAYFFFEPFLKLDLLDLRARGYNVDRILRAKAAEARIAEEERRKALEAEQKKIQEREKEWTRQIQVTNTVDGDAVKTPKHDRMPGAFTDSPEEQLAVPPQQPPKRSKGLFSQLSRRLGFENTEESQKQLENFLPEPQHHSGPSFGPTPPEPEGKRPKDDGRVTSPAVVQQNLLNAIKSTRAHDSLHLFSPPQQNEVKEQGTYCDSTPAQNINFAAEAPNGMRVFVAKDLSVDPAGFLSLHSGAIAQFENLLNDVGVVYGLSPTSLHMFYDEKGGTIAFNSKGSIFCNLRFFVQLHFSKSKPSGGANEARVEATTWWWVVIAHELAHNLVAVHNSDHSYYTESFIQEYFPKMMAKAAQMAVAGRLAPRTSTSDGLGDPRALPPPPPPPYERVAEPRGQHSSLLD